jgi:BirA family biotin operon repressor/biotin-[acetyl-CoA-carboxylase] ligase
LAFTGANAHNARIRRTSTIRDSYSASPAEAREAAVANQRLAQVLRLLTDHALLVVSGTKIAKEIGASRAEVWRLVQQLRAHGADIAGHPATGYRLQSIPDLLVPETLAPLLQGTIFAGRLHHFFKIGSTNLAAMQAAQAGEAEGATYFAEEQVSGRGRGGHSWHSERSTGIYVSVVLRPQLAPADVLLLSLAAGLAVAEAVEETCAVRPDLRWPNDLLLARTRERAWGPQLEERKFCGILTELNAEATRVRYAVVGIGMNVNQQKFPAELQEVATSLRIETGRAWSRVELAAALLKSLDREYRALRTGSAAAREQLRQRFEQRSSYACGRRVHVEEAGGYSGVTAGLDERGFLLVRTDEGLRTVLSGGVRGIE